MVWVTDEAHGDEGELMALSYLDYENHKRAPKQRFKAWDFWIERDGKRQFWEVKRDRSTYKTGNILIEFESNGEPSGIDTTKADMWMYILDNEPTIFMIPVTELRQMIADEKYDCIRRVAEYGKNKAYFFNRATWADYEYALEDAVPA